MRLPLPSCLLWPGLASGVASGNSAGAGDSVLFMISSSVGDLGGVNGGGANPGVEAALGPFAFIDEVKISYSFNG